MTHDKVRRLRYMMNHSDKWTISSAARKFECNRVNIRKRLRKLNTKRYHKKRAPKYKEGQEIMVKRHCAWLYRYFCNKEFIIDDEKYFALSHAINNVFFSSSPEKTPNQVKYQAKEKYEPKTSGKQKSTKINV